MPVEKVKRNDDDAYRDLICTVLKVAAQDAEKGISESDRTWIDSKNCAELCQMIDIDYEYFREGVLKQIQEHDKKTPKMPPKNNLSYVRIMKPLQK